MIVYTNPSLTEIKKHLYSVYNNYVSPTISDLSYLYSIQKQYPDKCFEFITIWLFSKPLPQKIVIQDIDILKMHPSETRTFYPEQVERFIYIITATKICYLYFRKDDYLDFYIQNTDL